MYIHTRSDRVQRIPRTHHLHEQSRSLARAPVLYLVQCESGSQAMATCIISSRGTLSNGFFPGSGFPPVPGDLLHELSRVPAVQDRGRHGRSPFLVNFPAGLNGLHVPDQIEYPPDPHFFFYEIWFIHRGHDPPLCYIQILDRGHSRNRG